MVVNWLDIVFTIILVLFFLRGLLRGVVKEVAGLISVIFGLLFASRYYTLVYPHINAYLENPQWSTVLSYVCIFFLVVTVVAIITVLLQKFMELTFISWLDHFLGAIVGFAKGALICSVGLTLLQRLVPESVFLKQSYISPYISDISAFALHFLPPLISTVK